MPGMASMSLEAWQLYGTSNTKAIGNLIAINIKQCFSFRAIVNPSQFFGVGRGDLRRPFENDYLQKFTFPLVEKLLATFPYVMQLWYPDDSKLFRHHGRNVLCCKLLTQLGPWFEYCLAPAKSWHISIETEEAVACKSLLVGGTHNTVMICQWINQIGKFLILVQLGLGRCMYMYVCMVYAYCWQFQRTNHKQPS